MCDSAGLQALIGPSILNSDLSSLADESTRLLEAGADYLHLDVMDGHFVPNLTFGHPVVKCLRAKVPNAMFDMHMMVAEPEKWVEGMQDAGADQYTFHLEATKEPIELSRKIREAGMKVGVAVKPGTPITEISEELFNVADMILVMTVEPGFGGQKFQSAMMAKVEYVRKNFPAMNVEVDGGLGPATIDQAAKAGANMIVSGTAVVKSPDPKGVMDGLRGCVREQIVKQFQ